MIPTDNPSTHTLLHVTVIEVYYDRGEQIPGVRLPWPLSSLQWCLNLRPRILRWPLDIRKLCTPVLWLYSSTENVHNELDFFKGCLL